MWVSATQKIPLSVLVRHPHKGVAREIFHKTGRGRGKEGPRVKRSGQNRAVSRRQQEDGDPGWPTREDESAFPVALREFRLNTRSQ